MVPNLSFFLSLIRSAIFGAPVPELNDGIDLNLIFRWSAFAHLDAIIYNSMMNAGFPLPEGADNRYLTGIMIDTRQKDAFTELCSALGNAGIDIMPLKGCLMKPLYPTGEMRYMGDLDILYRGDDDQVLRVMTDLGYTAVAWKTQQVHHIFSRDPSIVVELHFVLMLEDSPLERQLRPAWDRAERDSENPHLYRMSPEDRYLHMIAHAVKHMIGTGIGIRPVIDYAVFTAAYPGVAEQEFVRSALREAGMETFVDRMRDLADALSTGRKMTEEEERIFGLLLCEGTFGTKKTIAVRRMVKHNADKGHGKWFRYLLHRTFPSFKELSARYGWLSRGRGRVIFYPFFWVCRTCRLLFFKRKSIRQDIAAAATVGNTEFSGFRFERVWFGVEHLSGNKEKDDNE